MVKEEITKRHYFSEEELITLLQLPEKSTVENVSSIGQYELEHHPDLKEYKVVVTTLETVDLSDPE